VTLIVVFFVIVVIVKDSNNTIILTIKSRLMHIISEMFINELCMGGGDRSRCRD
jgi:hypothetical protein